MTDYVEFLTSLPHLHDPFRYRRPPISAVQLRKRFRMLAPEDQRLMERLRENVLWSSIPLATDDQELVERFEHVLAEVSDPQLCGWLHWRMDVRTVLAALRRRQSGQSAPGAGKRWGLGNLPLLIARNWNQPGFGLLGRFPWLAEAEQYLADGESLALEKCVLQQVWNYYSRCEADQTNGFAAVFLYVSRWDICHRWSSYDHEHGLKRFDRLVEESVQVAGINFEEWN